MKRLHYIRPNNLSLLHDELLAAIPVLAPVLNEAGEREPVMWVEGKGDDIWLTVPNAVRRQTWKRWWPPTTRQNLSPTQDKSAWPELKKYARYREPTGPLPNSEKS